MVYAEITLDTKSKFILRLTNVSDKFYSGIEVDKEGDPVVRRVKGQRIDETRHIIERVRVTRIRYMKMNNVYAMLEYEP